MEIFGWEKESEYFKASKTRGRRFCRKGPVAKTKMLEEELKLVQQMKKREKMVKRGKVMQFEN